MQISTLIIILALSVTVLVVLVAFLLWHAHRQERDMKLKDEALVREIRRNQKLVDYGVSQGLSRSAMVNLLATLAAVFLLSFTALPSQAQNQPAGMRMEVAEAETDKGEYSIFTYVDEDGTFGYYLSLGRTSAFLGADEILGMQVKNYDETTISLGATYDEALATLDRLVELYDKDLDTTVELPGRAATKGVQLGEPTTSQCTVVKKPLGGKRLQFVFTYGKHTAHAYLTKQVVKELRSELKIDKKLHPKQHR